MKGAALFILASAAAVQSAVIPPASNKIDWKYEQKRQILGIGTQLMGKGGKVADPPGAAPKKVKLAQRIPGAPNSQTLKIRYGPYSVINMQKTSITGEEGMLWNYPDTAIDKPCTECTIIGIQAGLEYPDGRNANIDTGMWLHHMVQFAHGPTRVDATCGTNPMSMPHFDVGATGATAERIWSSGNERTYGSMAFTPGNETLHQKVGMHINSQDKFSFIVDLMNMNMEDKTVYLTMTYDFIDGPMPADYDDVKPVWFDVNQCGTSEVAAKAQTGSYTLDSVPWTANFDGEILSAAGHLHDGGETLQIHVDGKLACDSRAGYGETPEYLTPTDMMAHSSNDKMAAKHISSMVTCKPILNNFGGLKQLKKGQKWQIKGLYDYNKNAGNIEHGRQGAVMAISIMLVKVPKGVYPLAKTASTSSAPAAAAGGSTSSLAGLLAGLGSKTSAAPATSSSATSGLAGLLASLRGGKTG